MKAELITNMITAHRSGVENNFRDAVLALAADEDKKGNSRVAILVREAYEGKNAGSTLIRKLDSIPKAGNILTAQSVGDPSRAGGGTATRAGLAITPRDKDSMLELYDLVKPTIRLDEVVLPTNQRNLLLQILGECAGSAKLAEHNLPPANRLLLCGPPGCGKTMTANAIANELGLPLAYVRLDGLVSSYLGQTSVNLRKVFDSVKALQVVLFLDEFDAIAKKRDDGNEMGELKRVVTALLQNFDNMPPNVFLIAATNHEHLLDPAVWRRFNYTITLGYPDAAQRAELIERWLDEYKVEHKINVEKLTAITVDRSTAQLKELITAAAKRYVTREKIILMDDVVELLVQQLTNNANDRSPAGSTRVLDAAVELSKKGASVRALAKAIGMPHNTLQYQINNLEKKDVSEAENNGE